MVLGILVVGEYLGALKRVRLHRKTPAHLAAFWQGWEFSVSYKGQIEG